ncbi:MAG: hypothetical protein HOM14_16400 [Gammaproteobacteria bacterium]|jgi:hypothetical protein|nr:hypothetical protein [Gammaproteobacteria bacterium]MBT3723218.1 hypothetical protein [Gammaproteobacteria bacterium]MBT4195779.1 hypothetical protein [Gammaproteobacteria bacterium]MBT4450152.1 hypothetical protein [Gammaproteobacteria bacterium]MBT4861274.1 hypothetical protein [Gammaproteobacteria bacterium]
MNLFLSKIRQVLLISVLSLSVLSCGVESIIAAGISGTGIVVGAITGFGSIIVNGVKYDIDEASFDVDGTSFNGQEGQSNLEIGMVVQLNATTYDDGTGVATSVVYDDAVEGPITDIPTLSDDDNNLKNFSVLGLNVTINALTTRFKNEDNTVFGFENITQGDVVEVSGYVDLITSSIVATHVEKKGTLSDGTNEVELHGVIEDLEETFFIMNGFTIDITQIGPNDLEDIDVLIDGLFVEVEGEYQSDGTIIATEIEGEDDERDEIENSDGHLSLEGVITSFTSTTYFSINGIPVFLDSGVASSEVLEQLKVGVQVEVEGIMENGVLQVDEIELEGEEEPDDD